MAAITGAGVGAVSGASAAATPATVPGAPTNVTCSPCSAALSPAVAFVTPVSNGGAPITGYTVTMIDNTDSTRGGQTFSGSASPISVSGFTNGDRYTFTVTGTNAAGTGAAGTSGNILPIYPPAAPTNVKAKIFSKGLTLVSWTAPANTGGSPITGYTATSNPGKKICTTTTVGTHDCIVFGLDFSTDYTFTVTATNAAGTSAASAASSSVGPATLLNAPTAVEATSNADGSASVSWQAPLNFPGITGYVVTPYIGSTAQTSQTFTAPALSLAAVRETVTGLTNGTTYTFTVAAVTAAGTADTSVASAAITTWIGVAGPPAAPTNVVAKSGVFLGTLKVSWTAPANTGGSPITGYTVTSSSGKTVQLTADGSFAIFNGSIGTAYTFTVTATNASGTSAASAASNSAKPRSTK